MIEFISLNLHSHYSFERGENLGHNYLAAILRNNGYTVRLREVVHPNDLYDIVKDSPMIVGMSPFIQEFHIVKEFCEQLKKELPNVLIMWGGMPVTSCKEEVLKEFSVVDFVVYGEGEVVIPKLVDALINGHDYRQLKGVAYMDNGKVVVNPSEEIVHDLDDLPFPCHDLLENKNILFSRISRTRGCYGNCTFCYAPVFFRKESKCRWRTMSENRVIEEMENVLSQYGIREFYFSDASLEDPPGKVGKDKLINLANMIIEKKLNIYYRGFFRGDCFSIEDKAILQRLYESGLEKAFIGVEVVTDDLIRLFNKRATFKECVETMRLIKNTGILVEMGFIFFSPYSSVNDLIEQAEFLRDSGEARVFSYFFTQLEAYQETPIRKKLQLDGLMKKNARYDDLLGYSFIDSDVQQICNVVNKFKIQKIFELLQDANNTELVLSRIQRRLGSNSVEELKATQEIIQQEMNTYFYNVFMKIVESYNNPSQINIILDDYIEQTKHFHIKILKLRRNMTKHCMQNNIAISEFSGRINKVG